MSLWWKSDHNAFHQLALVMSLFPHSWAIHTYAYTKACLGNDRLLVAHPGSNAEEHLVFTWTLIIIKLKFSSFSHVYNFYFLWSTSIFEKLWKRFLHQNFKRKKNRDFLKTCFFFLKKFFKSVKKVRKSWSKKEAFFGPFCNSLDLVPKPAKSSKNGQKTSFCRGAKKRQKIAPPAIVTAYFCEKCFRSPFLRQAPPL